MFVIRSASGPGDMLMRHLAHAVLPFVLPFLCAQCAGTSPAPTLAGPAEPPAREGYVDAADGVRLFYRIVGTGRDTIIVLNGGPGLSMSYLAADLEPLAGRHVLLFYDQRGGGGSTLVTDSASLDAVRFAEDLEALRKHFGLQQLTLLAHSWGGAVAALYAGGHPERVGRLLIVNAIPVRHTHRTQITQRLEARRDSTTLRYLQELHAAYVANPGAVETCRAYHRLWFLAAYADTAAAHRSRGDFCAGTPESHANRVENVDRFTARSLGDWDWRPALRAVTAPTLVIHGTADFIPPESAREWAASLPNGRLLLLNRSGHFPYLEEPDRFFAAAAAFLQGRWPVGAEPVSIPGPH